MLGSALMLLSLTAGVLLVPSLVTLLVVERHRHLAAAEDRTRRVRLVTAAMLVGLTALAVAALLGAGVGTASVIAVVLGASVLVWAPLSGGWAVRGVVVWSLATAGAAAFLGWVLYVMATSSLSSAGWIVAGAAWLLLVIALVPVQGLLRRLVTARAGLGTSPQQATPALVRPALSLVVLLAASGVVVTVSSNTAGPGQGSTPPDAAGTAAPEAAATPGVPTPVLSPAASQAPPTRSAAPGDAVVGATGAMPAVWAGDQQTSLIGALSLPVQAVQDTWSPPAVPVAGPVDRPGGGPSSAPSGGPVARPTPRSSPNPGAGPSSAPSPSGGAPVTAPGGAGGGPTGSGGGASGGTGGEVAPSPSSPASASPTVLLTRLHGSGRSTPLPQQPGAGPTPKGRGHGVVGSSPSGPQGPKAPPFVQAPPSWAPPISAPPISAPPLSLPPVALPPVDPAPPEHAKAKGRPSDVPPKSQGGSSKK